MEPSRSATHRDRMDRLYRALSRRRLDAICISHGPNIVYLTGFTGDDSWLLVLRGHPILVTDSRFAEQAETESPWCDLVTRRTTVIKAVGRLARKFNVHRLGLEETHVSAASWRKASSEMPGIELVALTGLVEKMRLVKDAHEIELIVNAQRCLEHAVQAVIAPGASGLVGKSENELAARLEYEMRLAGASGSAFCTIVAAGARGSLPHARPTRRPAAAGAPLLIDAGARVRSYNSDLTRTYFLDTIPARLGRIYDVVLEAQSRAINSVRPGVRLARVDKAARDVIERAGFGKYFGHGTGHGVGLEIHEAPTVGPRTRGVARVGMVFTVEPGVYIPGLGGVRIEDIVVVTDDGCQVITSHPKAREAALLRS